MEIFIELLNDTLHEIGLIFTSIPEGVWQFMVFAAATAAAVGAFLSARATRLAAQGQLFSQLLLRYSSEEMRFSLLKMESRYILRKESEKEFCKVVKTNVRNRVNKDGPKAEEPLGIDACRRHVSYFFRTALWLYENKRTIDLVFLRHLCGLDDFELLYAVVEHYEYEINEAYDRDSFTRLLHLSGRDDIQKLEELRPPKEINNKGF